MSDVVRSDTGPFVVLPVWIFHVGLSTDAIAIYAYLGTFADQTGVAFPGRKRISDGLGISLSTVDRRLRDLVEIGAVDVRHWANPNGRQTSNRYLLRRARPDSAPAVMSSPVEGDLVTSDYPGGVTVTPQVTRSRGTRDARVTSDDDAPSSKGRASSRPGPSNPMRDAREILDERARDAADAVDPERAAELIDGLRASLTGKGRHARKGGPPR